MKDPIDNIEWKHARELWANAWNPNVVFSPELKLLETSILKIGWTQPILVNPDNMIIDGFHRVQLSLNSQKLRDRYAEEVPCVTLDLSVPEAMMLTVRINRAKGTHTATRMSDLVKILIDDYGQSVETLMEGMGMTKSEVNLLADGSLLKAKNLKDYAYSKAWTPVETTRLTDEEKKEMGL